MNRPSDPSAPADSPVAERHSALFTGLVLQQANLASACLGLVPDPDTGRAEVDLRAATVFIDTLEMLEAKTRGNLTAAEAGLLADTLTHLRLAFVQASERPAGAAAEAKGSEPASSTAAPAATPPPPSAPAAPPAEEGGSGRRFVKRY